MKKILFVVAVLFIFIPFKVMAYTDSFYEGEYIENAYIKKFKGNSGKYEQMRILRRKSDNKVVYCLELWNTLNPNVNMTGYSTKQEKKLNIDSDKWERLVLIAYYGYGYQNHTDNKWIAITQFMIWKTLEDNSNIYFTDTLNGNKINKYNSEIEEINNLIINHKKDPKLDQTFFNKYIDNNNVLNDYEISNIDNNINISKEDNSLIINNSLGKNINLKLLKKDKYYQTEPVVYINKNSQNLLLPGSYPPVEKNINLTISTTKLTIYKIGEVGGDYTLKSEASLTGTTFYLYDSNHKFMKELILDDNNQIILNDIGYGTYYLKEIKSGVGYILDNEEAKININMHTRSFFIANQVIKNKIVINKYLKKLDGTIEKEDGEFIIQNLSNNESITFKTDNGMYELELPYGNYVLKKSDKSDVRNIKIEENDITQVFDFYNEEKEIEEIKDIVEPKEEKYEIIDDVPNTYKKTSTNIIEILMINLSLLYLKGKRHV